MASKNMLQLFSICLITLSLTLSTREVNAQRGPVDFYDCSGKQDGNYVHPSDCTKFIACVAGIYAYEMDCVPGLHYDPVNDRCDWPSAVGCIIDPPSTTPTTTVQTSTSTTSTQTTSSASTTTRGTSSTSRGTSSTTSAATTTGGTSSSAPSTTTRTTITTSTTTPPVFNCSGLPDGNYKHPTDCSKFVSCVAGEYAYEMDCPSGLHYDPRTNKCDYPEVVGCDPSYTTTPTSSTTTSSTTITPTQTTTTRVPPVFDCSGLPDGNYKHPTNCSKFISCVAGRYAYEMDCPEGLHYDPRTDQCDYPEIVGCERSNSTTTAAPSTTGQTEITTSATSPVPTITTNATTLPTESTTTIDPDACDHDCQYVGIDCHNYYTCVNFTRKEYHECPSELGLAFNPSLLVCDRIENVKECGGTTTELPTTPEDNECVCEYRPHESDCSKYYFCSNSCNQSTCELLNCPADLLWSVDTYGDGSSHQQCTLPERATCASKDSGTAHLEFSCFKKIDGMYRNKQDCHSYWKCDGGIALLYECPKDFIFNPELKSCDFPGRSLRFCTNNEKE